MDRRRCYKHALGDEEVYKVFWVSKRKWPSWSSVTGKVYNLQGPRGCRLGLNMTHGEC
jgi:hypothetical protein